MYKFLIILGCILCLAQNATAQTAPKTDSENESAVTQNTQKNNAKSADTKKADTKESADDGEEDDDEDEINWKKITPEEVEKLIKDGELKVDEYDYLGRTPLMNAAAECAKPEVLKKLIDNSADVNFYPPTDNPEAALATSALFMASTCSLDVVKTLVKSGAAINVYGEMGMSLLMNYAANAEDSKILSYLIKKGANVRDLDADGNHVLMYAIMNKTSAHKMIDTLLKKGVDINMLGVTPQNETFSVLDFAEKHGLDADAIKYLREKGAKHAAELYQGI